MGMIEGPGNNNYQMGSLYVRDSERFQRLVVKGEAKVKPGITDEMHLVIDTQPNSKTDTRHAVYLDCRKRKIFAKHLTFTLLRPIHTVLKMIYHVTIIAPVVVHVCDYRNQKAAAQNDPTEKAITKKECARRIVRSIVVDPFRTLGYGVAITATHVAAVIAAPLAPNSLYRMRKVAGDLDRALLRKDEGSLEFQVWNWVPCISPLTNMQVAEGEMQNKKINIPDRYQRYFLGQAQFRREHRAIFNDCFKLLGQDKNYLSPAACSYCNM